MRRDRHYPEQAKAPMWARKCEHCGRLMESWGLTKFGSNACRQAAYRLRLSLAEIAGCQPGDLTSLGPPIQIGVTRSSKAPKRNTFAGKSIINGKRFRGKSKGGAK